MAALEGVRTPSLVAKAVMENTDHHLLVGRGAQNFARQLGTQMIHFVPRDNQVQRAELRRNGREIQKQEMYYIGG